MPNNSLEAVIHRKIKETVPPYHQAEIMDAVRQALAEHKPGMVEVEVESIDHIIKHMVSADPAEFIDKSIKILGEWRLVVNRYQRAAQADSPPLEGQPAAPSAASRCWWKNQPETALK